MRLNHECVRSVLLAIEKQADFVHLIKASDLAAMDSLSEFDVKDVVYTVYTLRQHGFVESGSQDGQWIYGYDPKIRCLTFAGHNFLDDIRDKSIWRSVLSSVGSGLASVSITVLAELANKAASAAASKFI